jgi:murein DD-endopeptidase MepM/ murein hydrolase activator NlpD
MAIGTSVYSAKTSWVDFAGWDNTGYGNLIKSNTDFIYPRSYISYYAHLNSFVANAGDRIVTNTLIAYSGNTGNSSGPHLHFHVQTSTDPVDLRTLNYFDENGLYPSGNGNCGTMHR